MRIWIDSVAGTWGTGEAPMVVECDASTGLISTLYSATADEIKEIALSIKGDS